MCQGNQLSQASRQFLDSQLSRRFPANLRFQANPLAFRVSHHAFLANRLKCQANRLFQDSRQFRGNLKFLVSLQFQGSLLFRGSRKFLVSLLSPANLLAFLANHPPKCQVNHLRLHPKSQAVHPRLCQVSRECHLGNEVNQN